MNFLAHLYLSGDDPDIMMGNLAADFIRGRQINDLPPRIRAGVLLHREIDKFTDAHPLFKQSRTPFKPRWGLYSGILVDVFYDHLLAKHWSDYHPESLRGFLDARYPILLDRMSAIPARASDYLRRTIESDVMGSYATLEGIETALSRIKRRLRNPIDLEKSVEDFQHAEEQITADFRAFIPELVQFSSAVQRRLQNSE